MCRDMVHNVHGFKVVGVVVVGSDTPSLHYVDITKSDFDRSRLSSSSGFAFSSWL